MIIAMKSTVEIAALTVLTALDKSDGEPPREPNVIETLDVAFSGSHMLLFIEPIPGAPQTPVGALV